MKPIPVCLFMRVSRDKQDYNRQLLELNTYCQIKNFDAVYKVASKTTGRKTFNNREDLKELYHVAQKGLFEKVVVTEVSRLGRNAKDIHNTVSFLHSKKIAIVFKNLGGIESLNENGDETLVTNIIISIFSELAQEELRNLSDRIKSGLEYAKSKGKQIGRPVGSVKSRKQILKEYSRLAADLKIGLSLRKAMKVYEVSKGTVVKVKKALAD